MLAHFSALATAGGGRYAAGAIGLLLAACAGLAAAHDGAKGVVKDRMDLMKHQQKELKLLGDMARGKTAFDAAEAAKAARELGATTRKIADLFPKGSDGHSSEALDTIWEDWDRFTGNAKDAEAAADALATTLDDAAGADWKAGLQKLTDACKSCHESFRAKEKESGHH
jgi:cytochrome c556